MERDSHCVFWSGSWISNFVWNPMCSKNHKINPRYLEDAYFLHNLNHAPSKKILICCKILQGMESKADKR